MPTLNSCDKQCRPLCYPRLANLSETAPVTKKCEDRFINSLRQRKPSFGVKKKLLSGFTKQIRLLKWHWLTLLHMHL